MRFFGILLTLTLGLSLAHAERADKNKPIALSSDKASFDDVKQIYNLEDNVFLVKGTMIIKGDKAKITIDPEGYQQAHVWTKNDDLATIRQKKDSGIDEYVQGYAENIEYDAKNETATLTGKARMGQLVKTKIFDEITGDKIHYNAITEKYVAVSQESVKSILSPRRKDANNKP